MPFPNPPDRLEAQISRIRNAFAEERIVVHNYPPGSPDRDTDFLFRGDRLLAQAEHADDVERELRRGFGLNPAPGRADVINGLTVFTFANRTAQDLNAVVEEVNRAVRDQKGDQTITPASLDLVLHITGACCPATEPEVVADRDIPPGPPPPVPPLSAETELGDGVTVAVIDTGLLPSVVQAHSWLKSAPKVDGDNEGPLIGHYRGHGTFVAGVLRAMAPKAEILVHGLMRARGAVSESELAPLLVQVFQDTQPDIISMSAGTRTTSANILLSFKAFYDNYLKGSNTILVCAAGNDGDDGPFVPASLPGWDEKVAVGALDAQGLVADYSNRGAGNPDWVDVYARGSDMVNAYPNGPYKYQEPQTVPPRYAQFTNGMANWSGTSFSTPLVSGLIAARMSWSHETSLQAWVALRSHRGTTPDGRKSLRPGDADRGVNPPAGWTPN